MRKRLRHRVSVFLAPFVAFLLRLFHKSIRWDKRVDYELYRGKIIALLHGNAMGVCMLGIDRGIYALVSRFRDGDIAEKFLLHLGYKVVRGSSEEGRPQKGGSVGLLKLIKLIKQGETVAITVDGPKGPCGKVKSGVILLAQKTGVPIVPVYVDFDWAVRLRTWDRLLIPLPFSKARVRVGNPFWVLPEEDIEVKREELEEVLASLSSGKVAERALELPQS
ncbi:MAG: lysophospholipid acyltransferase family protein [Aquificaceae bacterium]|nr:lysophospholipid acyltransferase family protein [Aquificaceae bacterium]MDW8097678.1 lysophospholipid acyltransferase family protein [Aquificaceae bacterium]